MSGRKATTLTLLSLVKISVGTSLTLHSIADSSFQVNGTTSEVDGLRRDFRGREEFVGEGRGHIFGAFVPFLPPYLNVDVGDNLNKLGNAESTAFFLTRDIYIVSLKQFSVNYRGMG